MRAWRCGRSVQPPLIPSVDHKDTPAANSYTGQAWLFLGGEKLSIQVRSWAALEDAREELREFFLQSYYRAHGCFVCQNIYDADW